MYNILKLLLGTYAQCINSQRGFFRNFMYSLYKIKIKFSQEISTSGALEK